MSLNHKQKGKFSKTEIKLIKSFENSPLDKIKYINGVKVKGINKLLDSINWDSIYDNAIPSRFHGDFQPENIIYDNNDFKLTKNSLEQAKHNLKNLLLTTQGERFMQPKFGTRIREAVFQQNTINLEEFIKESLTEAIEYWLPYINLFGIDVRRNIDDHSVSIRLNFTIGVRGANVVIEILATENLITVVSEDITAPTGLVQVGQFGDEFAGGNY